PSTSRPLVSTTRYGLPLYEFGRRGRNRLIRDWAATYLLIDDLRRVADGEAFGKELDIVVEDPCLPVTRHRCNRSPSDAQRSPETLRAVGRHCVLCRLQE